MKSWVSAGRANRYVLAAVVFVAHMMIASTLQYVPSTPVKVDVPGLVDCPVNEFGGYDYDCIKRRSAQIDAHIGAHPPAADFRRRDAVSVVTGGIFGVILGLLLGKRAFVLVLAALAYVSSMVVGLISPIGLFVLLVLLLVAALRPVSRV